MDGTMETANAWQRMKALLPTDTATLASDRRATKSLRKPGTSARSPYHKYRRSLGWAEAGRVDHCLSDRPGCEVHMLTVLAVLLLGIFDFGRVLDAWLVATNAAREGARYGAIYGADPDMSEDDARSAAEQKATTYLAGGLGSRTDISGQTVWVRFPNVRRIGEPVTATVSFKVKLGSHIGYLSGISFITVTGVATMRL